MKTLEIPYLKIDGKNLNDTFNALQQMPPTHLNELNWQEQFPYCPTTFFQIAWHESGFFLHYTVEEDFLFVQNTGITGDVWKDSCVEFFFSPHANQSYYNLECNAIGSRLFHYKNQGYKEHTNESDLQQIITRPSLPLFQAILQARVAKWHLSIFLPARLIKEENFFRSGKIFSGNFYKCGDQTPVPHYVSWEKIKSDTPRFHSPESFGQLKLMPECPLF